MTARQGLQVKTDKESGGHLKIFNNYFQTWALLDSVGVGPITFIVILYWSAAHWTGR